MAAYIVLVLQIAPWFCSKATLLVLMPRCRRMYVEKVIDTG